MELSAKVNGVEIAYDTFGDPSASPMLLIQGYAQQMIAWHEVFCKRLAAKGYWVIRFDNRDVGHSTKLTEAKAPHPLKLLQATSQDEIDIPYTLLDMAKDAVGLLDALKIDTAHVVGVSMGGMIGQTMAIHYPSRVRTLTSIMSSYRPEAVPDPDALSVVVTRPPVDRAGYIEHAVKVWRILQGPHFPIDEAYIRDQAGRSFDRSYYPDGAGRQFAAIWASGSREEALKNVEVPTLVIHGDADPLVPVEGGRGTVAAIPGAELLIIEGMGHSLPAEVVPQIIEAIAKHAK
ncbi:MAG: alpha/beta fold hydrolase [Candidatus Thorarchaeota archaeon]